MESVNIADMAVETARTRLGRVLGALFLVGVAAPLLRRFRQG
jgi:hypothetical protein